MDNIRYVRDTPADPGVMPNIDITGRQRAVRQRQRPAERPNVLDVLEIRQHARAQFPTNDTILGARAAARLSAQDKAERRRHGNR